MKRILMHYFAAIVNFGLISTQFTWAMEHVPLVFKDLPKGVQQYIQHLPKITPVGNTDDPYQKSRIITDYLLYIGGYSAHVEGRDIIEKKVFDCIVNNQPIVRCMPGFPVASANPHKIPFEDKNAFSLGDLVALLTQNHISHEIGKLHKSGSYVNIYWEPLVYDLNQMCEDELGYPQFPKERIVSYQNTLKNMIRYLAPGVKIGKLDTGNIDEIYQQKYATLPVLFDDNVIHDYKVFMKEDLTTDAWLYRAESKLFNQKRAQLEANRKFQVMRGKSFDEIRKDRVIYKKLQSLLGAKQYINNTAYKLAVTVLMGNKRMAALMENEIFDYQKQIRQSVRADYKSTRNKLGIPMIYGSNGTPWHKVLVVDSNSVRLSSYKDVTDEVQYPYVQAYHIDNHELLYINQQNN